MVKFVAGFLLIGLLAVSAEDKRVRGGKQVKDEAFLVLPKGTKHSALDPDIQRLLSEEDYDSDYYENCMDCTCYDSGICQGKGKGDGKRYGYGNCGGNGYGEDKIYGKCYGYGKVAFVFSPPISTCL